MYGYEGKIIGEIEKRTEPIIEKLIVFEENEATVVMLFKGHLIKEFSTWCDYNGALSCIETALGEVNSILKAFGGISPESDVSLAIRLRVCKINKRKVENRHSKYSSEYESVGYPYDQTERIVWTLTTGFLEPNLMGTTTKNVEEDNTKGEVEAR